MRVTPGWLVLALLLSAAVALPAAAQDYARGEALFELCSTCHGSEGEGVKDFLAPSIAGLEEWYVLGQLTKFRSGARGTNFYDLSGMRMRPMSLTLRSEADVALIASYVASLPTVKLEPTVDGDASRGKALYDSTCSACHGPKGEGVQALSGPSLAQTSDWYLVSQLVKFREGIRGSDPRDPSAIMMRPMAMALPDDQAVKDVVAYITTLAD